ALGAPRTSQAAVAALPMASHEWLWQSLRAGQHALITGLAPQDFDWKSSHPVFGSPLMATVHRAVLDGGPEVIEMVRLCMRMGADPRTSVRSASALSVGLPPPPPAQGWHCYDDSGRIWWQYDGMLGLYWCEDNQKHDSDSYSCPEGELTLKVIAEEHSGHSAISLLLAIKRKLECWGAAYKHYMKRIDSLCSVFMEGGLVLHDPWKTLQYINEGVVQTWSSIMGDQDRADVELKAGGESSVWAHGLVLCNASPVLKAALGSLMREGRTQKVEVSCSEEALRHLLALIYTGCPEKDHRMAVQLQALELAHMWQIGHLVEALETKICKQLPQELPEQLPEEQRRTMEELLQAAKLKQLPRLWAECHRLAGEGNLRGEFGRNSNGMENIDRKRRRTLELS
ncbi:unnamed protein product, partial [Effrenium voratum]